MVDYKSDFGKDGLEETWVGYMKVWPLSNVVSKDEAV